MPTQCCMQLSVDIVRWPDATLVTIGECSTPPLSASEVREELHRMKREGYEVVPCAHDCDPRTGRCLGTTKGK